VEDSSGHGNVPLGSTAGREFLDQLSDTLHGVSYCWPYHRVTAK
jgi:hypothetical protein